MALPVIIPVISLILTAASTAYSIYAQEEARSAQNSIADANAERIRIEAEESAMRAEKEADRTNAMARARAAASGVGGKSSDLYLWDLQRTQQREIDWIRFAGMSNANITKMGGSYVNKKAQAEQVSTMFSGIGRGFEIAQESNMFGETTQE